MRNLFLVTHQTGYRAFEDYYVNLKYCLKCYFEVHVIIYRDENEIPRPSDSQEVYMFFGSITPRFLNLYIAGKHRQLYLINTEQSTRPLWSLIINHYIKMGINICDYDLYQTDLTRRVLKSQVNSVYYLPYQITKEETTYLTSLVRKSRKSYQVAFCSTNQSKKRVTLYNQLISRGITVMDVQGWGQSRDESIAKSQILINVHFDSDYQIFEHMRCDRWILSGLLVVSEESRSDTQLDCKDLLIIEAYDRMVEKIVEVLDHYEEYYAQYLQKLMSQKKQIMVAREKHCQQFIDNLLITH
jgi:hypothetical protein